MASGGLDKERLLQQIVGAGRLYEEAQSRGGENGAAAEARASSLCRDLADSIKAEWRREDLAESGPPAPRRKPRVGHAVERSVATRMSNDYSRFADLDSDSDAEAPVPLALSEQADAAGGAHMTVASEVDAGSSASLRVDPAVACPDEAENSDDSDETPIDVPPLSAEEIAMTEAAEAALYADAARFVHSTKHTTVDYKRFEKVVAEESDAEEEQSGYSETYKIAHRLAGVVDEVRAGEAVFLAGKDHPCKTDTVRIGSAGRVDTKYSVDYSRFADLCNMEDEDVLAPIGGVNAQKAEPVDGLRRIGEPQDGGDDGGLMLLAERNSSRSVSAACTHRRRGIRKGFGACNDQQARRRAESPPLHVADSSFALDSMD